MSPGLQYAETLTSPAAGSLRRRSGVTAGAPEAGRLLVRRPDGGHARWNRTGFCCFCGCIRLKTASGILQTGRKSSRALDSILARQLADGGFYDLYQRPLGRQREREGVLRPEAGGHAAGRPADDAAARAHPGARRHTGRQQLHEDQPEPVRPVSARRLPVVPPEIMLLGREFPVPDVVLDAGDRGAAVDRCTRPIHSVPCRLVSTCRSSSFPVRRSTSRTTRKFRWRNDCSCGSTVA